MERSNQMEPMRARWISLTWWEEKEKVIVFLKLKIFGNNARGSGSTFQ